MYLNKDSEIVLCSIISIFKSENYFIKNTGTQIK